MLWSQKFDCILVVEILKIKNELLAAILLSGAESEDKVSEEHLSYASYIIYHISNYIGTVYIFIIYLTILVQYIHFFLFPSWEWRIFVQ